MQIEVGIEKIGMYVPEFVVDMKELAQARGVDPDKYTIGIGQDMMAVQPIDQDIVSMAVNAAHPIVDQTDRMLIDQVIVGTESGFDYSKSAATWVHELLNIQPFAKAYEIKQACYGGTAALQTACDYVRLHPDRKVLVVMADIARYGLQTGGEPTQGAGAVALLISAQPSILAIEPEALAYTNNQFDFWRPAYSAVALVDGKFSTQLYVETFVNLVQAFVERYPAKLDQIHQLIFHIPFTKMGKKALLGLAETQVNGWQVDQQQALIDQWLTQYDASTVLSRQIGNIYTGSLYLGLISSLIHNETLEPGQQIGLFSYGSGAVAELLLGRLGNQFKTAFDAQSYLDQLQKRTCLTIPAYEAMFNQTLEANDGVVSVEKHSQYAYARLERVDAHRRYYHVEKN